MTENVKWVNEVGTFEGVIVDHRLGIIPNEKQTPYIEFDLDSDGEFQRGKKWLSDKALEYTINDLREMGWTGDDITKLGEESDDPDNREVSLRGAEVRFTTEEYQKDDGTTLVVTKGIYPMNSAGRGKVELSPDVTKALRSKSKAIVKSKSKKKK